ncbi:unnamed protein product [Lampetra planeri]
MGPPTPTHNGAAPPAKQPSVPAPPLLHRRELRWMRRSSISWSWSTPQPSCWTRCFAHRRWKKTAFESALGYHSALLAIAGVSLVLQKLLSWVRKLRVAMPAADDDDFTSLCAARCIQAHLQLQEDATVAACAGPLEGQGHDVDLELTRPSQQREVTDPHPTGDPSMTTTSGTGRPCARTACPSSATTAAFRAM